MRYLGRLKNKKTSSRIKVDSEQNPTIMLFSSFSLNVEKMAKKRAELGLVSEEFANNITNGSNAWQWFGDESNFDIITGKLPVFEIKFKLDDFVPTNSGGYVRLFDLEEETSYPIYNYEIGYLLDCITNPEKESYISKRNGIFVGLFTFKNSGGTFSLRPLKFEENELQFLEE